MSIAFDGPLAVMLMFGFSINTLSLFGLVLAIGIVVDDAIVVVEAVEHNIEHGLSPKEASLKAMEALAPGFLEVKPLAEWTGDKS